MSAEIAGSVRPLRLALERGRLLLSERVQSGADADPDARLLLHDVNNAMQVLFLLERTADGVRWREHAERALEKGRDVHARVRAYADRHRLAYVTLTTPMPGRHETIESLVAAMPPRSTLPPPEVAHAIVEGNPAFGAEADDAIPPSAPTLPQLEVDDGEA